jgi:hypothetical protein
MYMRYTHFGVGHPTAQRELTRDCENLDPLDNPESDETGDHMDWESGIQSYEGKGDGRSDGGEEEDEDELEDEDEDADDLECESEDGERVGELGDVEIEFNNQDQSDSEDEEDYYHVSF